MTVVAIMLTVYPLGVRIFLVTKLFKALIFLMFGTDIGPPPDLPSLLLSNRVVYLGMPIVPSVSEVIIAQLLFLNFQSDQTVTMYINSVGTNAPDGSAMSFDTEAFAIADTMMYIKPQIRTICVGQAHGTAAMLLALGQKGLRCALPNASIMLNQPKSRSHGQASDVAIKAQELLIARHAKNSLIAQVVIEIKQFTIFVNTSSLLVHMLSNCVA